MHTLNATEFRSNLYQELAKIATGAPLRIVSKKGDCVILSAKDWESIEETLYLMGNEKDWKAITESLELEDCAEKLPW